jgi:E3 ubiquitin-protein ligase AMFR
MNIVQLLTAISVTQNISSCIVKYVLFKLVLVLAIIEPEDLELIFWIGCFSIIGLLRIMTTLCKDRFDYVSYKQHFTPNQHQKYLNIKTLNITHLIDE